MDNSKQLLLALIFFLGLGTGTFLGQGVQQDTTQTKKEKKEYWLFHPDSAITYKMTNVDVTAFSEDIRQRVEGNLGYLGKTALSPSKLATLPVPGAYQDKVSVLATPRIDNQPITHARFSGSSFPHVFVGNQYYVAGGVDRWNGILHRLAIDPSGLSAGNSFSAQVGVEQHPLFSPGFAYALIDVKERNVGISYPYGTPEGFGGNVQLTGRNLGILPMLDGIIEELDAFSDVYELQGAVDVHVDEWEGRMTWNYGEEWRTLNHSLLGWEELRTSDFGRVGSAELGYRIGAARLIFGINHENTDVKGKEKFPDKDQSNVTYGNAHTGWGVCLRELRLFDNHLIVEGGFQLHQISMYTDDDIRDRDLSEGWTTGDLFLGDFRFQPGVYLIGEKDKGLFDHPKVGFGGTATWYPHEGWSVSLGGGKPVEELIGLNFLYEDKKPLSKVPNLRRGDRLEFMLSYHPENENLWPEFTGRLFNTNISESYVGRKDDKPYHLSGMDILIADAHEWFSYLLKGSYYFESSVMGNQLPGAMEYLIFGAVQYRIMVNDNPLDIVAQYSQYGPYVERDQGTGDLFSVSEGIQGSIGIIYSTQYQGVDLVFTLAAENIKFGKSQDIVQNGVLYNLPFMGNLGVLMSIPLIGEKGH